ncbi:MAG: spore germination protein [Clostridia bacterium]|nr:spore germination protein [Clostridia bacterium]
MEIGKNTKIKVALIFMDGLANKNAINENIILPLMYYADFPEEDKHSKKNFQALESSLLSVGEVEQSNSFNQLVDKCLYGDLVFLVDGFKDAFIIDAKGWDSRNISEPTNEVTVRGPRECLEDLPHLHRARRKV